ncbi:unnamed protein product [Coregonus sp. 'balchen']|nr:unnamed protein product [Coregonus sp. 'balchen']
MQKKQADTGNVEKLKRWLDEKQKGNSGGAVSCPQCGTEYHIVFPKMGPLVYFLQQVDSALSRASPFTAAGVVVGTVYWSAVTYGAVTVMQVVGHKKGLDVMERADPLFLLMGIGRPLPRVPADAGNGGDHLSVSRTLCGALIFPSVASLVGRLIFSRVPSSLQRTVLGGIAFVVMKGVLKVYFKQQQYLIQANCHILNYPERGRDGEREGQGEGGEDDTEDSGN